MADGTPYAFPGPMVVPGRSTPRPARAGEPAAARRRRQAEALFPDEGSDTAPPPPPLAHLDLARRTPSAAACPEQTGAAAAAVWKARPEALAPRSSDSPADAPADTPAADLSGLAPGALVETADGRVPVEELAPGDRVVTRDRGLQPLRWVGTCELAAEALAFRPQMAPVRILRGALGGGLPERDLVLAPGHRLMLRTGPARALCGAAEVLVVAADLVGLPGIDRVAPACGRAGPAAFLQLMCDDASGMLLRIEGIWCQSFRPDRARLTGLSLEDRAALAAVSGAVPAARGGVLAGPGPRRPELRGTAVRRLLQG